MTCQSERSEESYHLVKVWILQRLTLPQNDNGANVLLVLPEIGGGVNKSILIYNNCDHAECYKEVEAQAISYTAGVPPVAAAILIAQGLWDCQTMVNVEELDPTPFIKLLDTMGLPTLIIENPTEFVAPKIEHLENI